MTAAARRTTKTLANGTSEHYSYDVASQLLGITYKNGSVTLDTLSYTLNIQGNRTSRTQGTLTENYTYDPFGKRTVYNATGQQIPESAYANTHGYTGREHLPLRGLMDYRNRSYSTTLGRFLQVDPIGFDAGDVNLYRYAYNNPISVIDPSGLMGFLIRQATKPKPKPKLKHKGCRPCNPPAGSYMYRVSLTGKPHAGIPCPHSHQYQVNQAPYPSCQCFINNTGITLPGILSPPIRPVTGGGKL